MTAFAALFLAPPPALAEEAPICADRPGKATGLCTVPAGQWQLESQAVGWSRVEEKGSKSHAWVVGSSVVRLGLGERSDLHIGITPWVHVETVSGGVRSTASGFGDVTVRYKHRLTADGAPVQIGLIPFVKLPTAAHDIGNGKVEGGLAVPIVIEAFAPLSVTLGPEVDLLADADGDGRHLALVNVAGVSVPVAGRLTLSAELWTATDFDPAKSVTQASADAALAYLVNNGLQLDAGANVGLNSHTPDIELYAGISLRF